LHWTSCNKFKESGFEVSGWKISGWGGSVLNSSSLNPSSSSSISDWYQSLDSYSYTKPNIKSCTKPNVTKYLTNCTRPILNSAPYPISNQLYQTKYQISCTKPNIKSAAPNQIKSLILNKFFWIFIFKKSSNSCHELIYNFYKYEMFSFNKKSI